MRTVEADRDGGLFHKNNDILQIELPHGTI